MTYRAGMDIGSTTMKLIITDDAGSTVFSAYHRHLSDISAVAKALIAGAAADLSDNDTLLLNVTGSAGMGFSQRYNLPFTQEVVACAEAVTRLIPQTDVAVELGGEDSKITYFRNGLEQRMNGVCAGGTGAFIDQMATLLGTDAEGLNELAKNHKRIYPIASRCGVFAKSDIQPLINQGADRSDIAASIFQAVVNQTIAGLASGRKIKGNVALLGGPLHFLSELRVRFEQTLGNETMIFPDNGHFFVALGAAQLAGGEAVTLGELTRRISENAFAQEKPAVLEPLFKSDEELEQFRQRHALEQVAAKPLAGHSGATFLGLDAGSTTTKLVLTDPQGNLLYTYYAGHGGDPLVSAVAALREVYARLPKDTFIAQATVVGYGENLIKSGLKFDIGEVETIAHFKAANKLFPGVDFIVDIGGQDMKVIRVSDGALTSVILNEACSAGCGSFVENFAKALEFESVEAFAEIGLFATAPADLGHKCTVFMNSKVKQAQKDGATIADISAGLSYSVVKNALYKVIKLHSANDLGEKIVCQGGTFLNDAVLRAFEKIAGRQVVRPDIAGLMGAYGAALIARERYSDGVSALLDTAGLNNLTYENSTARCNLCENRCLLTITAFSDGARHVSGNRCERGGSGKTDLGAQPINIMDYRYSRLFNYKPLKTDEAKRGRIGIPRALNIYENYPLWHTALTALGFRVELSSRSSKTLYEKGMDSIPSDTICYPAKISHGHVRNLVESGVPVIFLPTVVGEKNETGSEYHFNCPVLQGYPVILKRNEDAVASGSVKFLTPTFDIDDFESVVRGMHESFAEFGVTEDEMRRALRLGYEEQQAFRDDIHKRGDEALDHIRETGGRGIILAGRPYHNDPEINHEIAKLITREGFHVLTADSVVHRGQPEAYRINNKWVYDTRIFIAAQIAAESDDLEFVLLNSFGCGTDSIIIEQVEEILSRGGKLTTILRIDEISNLGSINIRIRSLKAALRDREREGFVPKKIKYDSNRVIFTKGMADTHTILIPAMYPIRERGLLDVALEACGYKTDYLRFEVDSADIGVRYINNDYCHTVFDYMGQIVKALESGKYDLNRVAVMIFDSLECPCRGSNFGPLMRKALNEIGYPQVPIVSYMANYTHFQQSIDGQELGLQLTEELMRRMMLADSYGILFENMVRRTRPYETFKGQIDTLHQNWMPRVTEYVREGSIEKFAGNMRDIVRDFDETPLLDIPRKPRIGLIGDQEIPIDFSLDGANDIVHLIEAEGAETHIASYGYYGTYNMRLLGEDEYADRYLDLVERPMNSELQASKRFGRVTSIIDMGQTANEMAPFANYNDNFWFNMAGRMIEMFKDGVFNIINFNSFNCTLNYITGVGLNKELKRMYPKANIIDVDYGHGIPAVNQINRIKLLIARAKQEIAV